MVRGVYRDGRAGDAGRGWPERRLGQCQRARVVVVEAGGDGRRWWGRVGSTATAAPPRISFRCLQSLRFRPPRPKWMQLRISSPHCLSQLTASKQRDKPCKLVEGKVYALSASEVSEVKHMNFITCRIGLMLYIGG